MTTIFRRTLLACSSMGLLSAPAIAADQARATGIEEIVVTARKREESLQDAPLTMTAYSAERVDEYDLTSLERIADMTPNLYVGRVSNGSGAQITMRGIGASSATSIGIEQSVAVVVNGAYFGQGRTLNEGMFDLGQIEILKGPQSLFFGKNATAGVISLTTAKPTDELEASLSVDYEFTSERTRYEGILSGPLGDRAAARLAVRLSDMDGGYYKNSSVSQPFAGVTDLATGNVINTTAPGFNAETPQEEETLIRLTLTADPTDNLSLTLTAQTSEVEVLNSAWNHVHFSCDSGVSLSGLPCGDQFRTAHLNLPDILTSLPEAGNGEVYNDYESYYINLEAEWDLGSYTLTSITNIQENENSWALPADFSQQPNAVFATELTEWEAFSQELRLTSDLDGPFNFMVGVLYQETTRDFSQWVTFGFANWNSAVADPANEFVTYNKVSSTDGETFSPFAELSFDISDTVTATIGARYTDETKDSIFTQPYVHPIGTAALNWIEGSIPADQDFDELSPEATISWQVNDEINLYAAYKSAYKSGGFSNGAVLAGSSIARDFFFDQETADGFEIGMKSTLLDNQLRFNVSLYSYNFDDLQLDYFNPTAITFITLNAGEATTEGMEMDLEWAPANLPGLRVHGSLAYNKAEYDTFIAPCWEGQTAATGCNATVPETNGAPGQDISGEATGMAPEWTASVGVNYDTQLANGWSVGFTVDAQYSDEYNASALGHPLAWRDSYTLWNASTYLESPDGHWQFQLLGKNLTDELVISGMLEAAFSGVGRSQADLIGYGGLPRTVSFRVKYSL